MVFFFPRIIATAVATIMTAKAIIRTVSGRYPPASPPAKAPTMPAAPKTSPVRQRTLPFLACATALISEVVPTTNSDAAMASLAPMPAT